MNCYRSRFIGCAPRSRVLVPIILGMIVFLISCQNRNQGVAQDDLTGKEFTKPSIDTSKVLKPLDLYRAKRVEGIQEALNQGADQVYKLILYGRDLESIPPEIGRLTYLASLEISHNHLSRLPDEISELHYLQGLYATHNRLTRFPDQILLLPVLARIDLSGNQISKIPSEIGIMNQLTRLTMDQNNLTSIPLELYTLTNLSVLELADNGLDAIPEGIAGLKSLNKLDLSGNQLERLPREITTLGGNLKELNIQGNRIPAEEVQWLIETMPGTRIRY
jgi:Leucine-rich repeat (LRR) protein